MIVVDNFVKRTILLRAIAPRHGWKPPSLSMAGTMEAALLIVVDNRWEAVAHIHKEAAGNVAAGVCSCVKVAARETGRSCSTAPPPTTDGGC